MSSRRNPLGLRGRFTVAIAGTVTAAVLALIVAAGTLGAQMLERGHDIALRREASRAAALVNADADYLASGTCEYSAAPACTAIIEPSTAPGDTRNGLTITAAQVALTASGPDTSRTEGRPALWSSATIRSATGSTPVRVITLPLRDGRALVAASPTTVVDRSVHRLWLILTVAGLATVLGAAGASAFVASRTVRPILRLTDATEQVVSAGDPAGRVALPRNDELGRLAQAVDDMLARLDRAETARRHLIEDASHDLRSPLTALSTQLELLQRDDLTARLHGRLVSDAQRSSADMTRLVQNIADLAVSEGGPLHRSDYAPRDVVAEAASAAERRWPRVRFAIRGRLEAGAVTASGDPELLTRALLNLLDNAAKYGPGDGVVHVDIGSNHGAWWVTVTDEGPGIAVADLPHVFDRAYRAEDARRRPGSGIGLAMAKHTAERHGGTLTARSGRSETVAAPRRPGTAFRLHLPISH